MIDLQPLNESEHTIIVMVLSVSPGGGGGVVEVELVTSGVDDGIITMWRKRAFMIDHLLTFPYFSNTVTMRYLLVQAYLQQGRDQTLKHFYQMDY